MFYLTITLALFLLRFSLAGQPQQNRQLYPVVLSLLFLFSAFRYEVGCDWSGYLNQYERAQLHNLQAVLDQREALWWTILGLQSAAGIAYPWINVLSSAIFFAGVHVLARRQPDSLGFLILLFPVLIINMPMSGIRQGAAIGLICIAMVRFLDGRSFAFGFWVLLATGFHSSAAIFLLFLPLVARRAYRLRLVAVAALAIPGAYLLLGSEAGQVASERYIDTNNEAFGAVFRITLLVLSGGYFLIFLRRAWRQSFPADYPMVLVAAVGMLGVCSLLPVSSVIADRIGYYLIPAQAMIFARIPRLAGLRHRGLLAALPYLGLLLFFMVWTTMSEHFQQCYLPYDNWLFRGP